MYFEKKKFEIRSIGLHDVARKFTYFTENDERSKYLLQVSTFKEVDLLHQKLQKIQVFTEGRTAQ